jgi:hypothetical protein
MGGVGRMRGYHSCSKDAIERGRAAHKATVARWEGSKDHKDNPTTGYLCFLPWNFWTNLVAYISPIDPNPDMNWAHRIG